METNFAPVNWENMPESFLATVTLEEINPENFDFAPVVCPDYSGELSLSV